jgi:hypothetical protein
MRSKRLTVEQRREIFKALVNTQDQAPMNVRKSYETITEQFGITDAQLRQIEDEGIEKEWPPLNEPAEILAIGDAERE